MQPPFWKYPETLGVTLKISYLNGTADHDGFFSEDESLSHDGARWDDTVVVYVLLIGSSLWYPALEALGLVNTSLSVSSNVGEEDSSLGAPLWASLASSADKLDEATEKTKWISYDKANWN